MTTIDIPSVTVESDVVFGTPGGRELLCDVYRPSEEHTKRTAIVHLHGGGFRAGSRAGTRLAKPLTALGYTSISASYRLANEANWPAQLNDVKTCIRWARANADRLGFEADKVVVLGHSAGAHLALCASGTQNDSAVEGDGDNPNVTTEVAACIAFYPPAQGRQGPPLGPDASEALKRTFNPIEHVKAGFPPTMLLHGTTDQTIPVDASLQLYNALRAVGAAVELHVIEGVTHIFDSHQDLAQASAVWIDLFLDRHVVNPRVYPSTEPR
jgi:acetyl esterase/lipase